jgi:predicted helicase
MSALGEILTEFRSTAGSQSEKGFYFESLVKAYLKNEPLYRDLYGEKVFLWSEWRTYWQQSVTPLGAFKAAAYSAYVFFEFCPTTIARTSFDDSAKTYEVC